VQLRLILVLTIVAVGTVYSLRSPFRALLFYLWFAYFRPEYWAGWVPLIRTLRLSLVIGSFVVIATILTRKRLRFGLGPLLMFLFL
jgi:hypothetical protein